MAVQEQVFTLTSEKKKGIIKSKNADISQLLSDIDTILSISVLKYRTSKTNPLPYSILTEAVYAFHLDPDDIDEQTRKERISSLQKKIRRKMNDYLTLFHLREQIAAVHSVDGILYYDDLPAEEALYCKLADMLCLSFGGTVCCTKSGRQKLYFQPMIRPNHIKMIQSCLAANQYFSERETVYLIHVVETLGLLPSKYAVDNTSSLLEDIQDRSNFLSEMEADIMEDIEHTYPLLHIINELYIAITQEYQIEMIKGSYAKNKDNKKISLQAVHAERPYRLNPYALFFSDGHHYLIATKTRDTAGEEIGKILHFRVDRILSVKVLQDHARESRPSSLQDYWKNKETGFDQKLYSQKHPTMVYSQNNSIEPATLLSKHPIALSIVADAFGKDNIRITKEHSPIAAAEAPSGFSQKTYEIEIQAQKENIIRFCLQQHALVKLLNPPHMVRQVREELRQALADYEKSDTV